MYTLLVPRSSSVREKKPGRQGPFWKSFWEKMVAEDPEVYKRQYEERLRSLNTSSLSFNTLHKKDNKKYYVEAKLDEKAHSKSTEPEAIWKEAGLQIVETRDDGTITLSGYKEDYNRLKKLLTKANFASAANIKTTAKVNEISREVFSVTALYDKSIEKRLTSDVKSFLISNDTRSIDCLLSVFYDHGLSEYDALYNILIGKVGEGKITKIDTDFFVSNMAFRANLNKTEIKTIVEDEDCNFISLIKTVSIYGSQRTTPNANPNNLIIGRLLTDEKIVVIDSGIDQQVINNYVIQRESHLTSGQVGDKNHGTAVASRILFGDDIFTKIQNGASLDPVGRIIDVQVLHKAGNDTNVDDPTLLAALNKTVRKYVEETKLFNLSVSNHNEIDEVNVSEVTEMIDTLSNEKDILFICATGNQHNDFALGYPEIFNTPGVCCHIAAPSDAINALTVGSITGTADAQSLCEKMKYPSPFTRRGGLRNDMKKPELVAVGGNIQKDATNAYGPSHLAVSKNTYGVHLIDASGFVRDIGSSFSAPLVTRESMLLLDYLKKSSLPLQLSGFKFNNSNLIKALLIHSTARVAQSSIDDHGLKRAYGFGQPNYLEVLKDNPNQVTIVYADKINFREKKQKVLVHLPDYLLGKEVEFTLTFVYNPPVNKNFAEYKMINLEPSLGFVTPEIVAGNPTGKSKTQSNNPDPSWENYRNDKFNTFHFTKQRKRLTRLDLQVKVEMMVSNHFLKQRAGHEDEIAQNYALVLTVNDKSNSNQLRSEILNSNQFVELVENFVQVQS